MPKNVAGTTSPEILQAALQGLEIQREKLDEQIAQVRALLGHSRKSGKGAETSGKVASASSGEAGGTKRNLSPDARKRIAAAQKKRWAAFRKTQK